MVELGCGSGLLAAKLIEYGAASYLGIDIAETAIRKARESHGGRDARIAFAVGGVAGLQPLAADLVISLGLFDWLRDDEIANVFAKSGTADFLHAIAERRPGIQQWLHRAYVQLAYGYRTASYRPRYFTCAHIEALAIATVPRRLYVYRNRRLSFGALISSLPSVRRLAADYRKVLLHRMRPRSSRHKRIFRRHIRRACVGKTAKCRACGPQYVGLGDISASTSRQNLDRTT